MKESRLPAPHQELILAALQEEGWPERLDDPLPGKRGVDPRRRLRSAVRGLTLGQVNPLLWFEVERGARGLRWRVR